MDYLQKDEYHLAIEIDPNHAFAFESRGLAYIEMGDYRRAIEDHDRSIEIDPTPLELSQVGELSTTSWETTVWPSRTMTAQ